MTKQRFYGVMVSTLDSESSYPSSNLGRTCFVLLTSAFHFIKEKELPCGESNPGRGGESAES